MFALVFTLCLLGEVYDLAQDQDMRVLIDRHFTYLLLFPHLKTVTQFRHSNVAFDINITSAII